MLVAMSLIPSRKLHILLALLFALPLCACGGGNRGKEKPAGDQKRGQVHLVEIATAHTENLAYSAVRTGSLRARQEVNVFNQEEGRIQALPFYEGDRVSKGEVLVRLDDSLLRAELDKAEANRQQAASDLKRLRGLADRRLTSEDELARAETALQVAQAEEALLRTRLGYTVIHAPFAALVSARLVSPGDVVPKYTHLMTLIDPSSLVTEVPVSELLLPQLGIGDAVTVRIDALGEQAYEGRILRMHPTVDPRTRQGVVEIELTPVPPGARAGQLCRVTLVAEGAERRVIPFSALRRDTEGEFVFRVDEEQKAARTAVHSGLRLADRVEILEGLANGDQVVTKGFLALTDGTPVKVVGAGD